MLNPGSDTKIYLCIGHTDMRKGANGLSLLAESILANQFCSGAMFVFRVSVWGSRSINYHKAIVAYLHNKKEVTIW